MWNDFYQSKCTVWLRDDFDAGAVAEKLRDAMDGLGTNESEILDVLGNHCNAQRLEIAEAYKVAYGKDLIDDLKDELGGNFETLCVALLIAPRLYDAKELHDAVCGVGTDETVLTEIMCMRTNEEIQQIKEAYKAEYEQELEEDLQGDTSGYFGRLMVSLCVGGRESDSYTEWLNEDKAMEDAQKLLDAGEATWGTEEAEMNAVLCLSSPGQLRLTLEKYEELTGGTTVEEAIDKECSGSLKEGYLAIVEGVRGKPKYFARRLHDCFSGLGTSDNDLIRIIVTRSEIDLEDIKDRYQEMYGTSLAEAVEGECSGDYKRLLLALINLPA
ncbi:annexin A5-like [Babylonia areolata]|uniref:annexin A5-like n=1 Tax=Babylonia areolata TaxID=304850 RepID=UPI003FCF2AAC